MAHKATPYIPSSADLAAVALTGSASDLGAGTLPIARIANGAVTLAKLVDLANATVIGRNTAGTGVPEAVTMSQLATLLGFAGGAWVTDTIGANGQNIATSLSMSGADQDYEFQGEIALRAVNQTLTMEVNSVSTNQTTVLIESDTAAVSTADETPLLVTGTAGANAATCRIVGRIHQMSGAKRLITWRSWTDITGVGTFIDHSIGLWDVTTTVTAFRFHSDNATGILTAGTSLRVRRV